VEIVQLGVTVCQEDAECSSKHLMNVLAQEQQQRQRLQQDPISHRMIQFLAPMLSPSYRKHADIIVVGG